MNEHKAQATFALVKQGGNWVKVMLPSKADIDVQAHVVEEPKLLEQK